MTVKGRRLASSTTVLLLTGFILLFLSLIFFPLFITTSNMINYSNVDVKEMSQEQMDALKGLKFVEHASSADNVITREQLPKNCRVIPPGSMVTMDFQEDRLNVHLDNQNIIKKVKKG